MIAKERLYLSIRGQVVREGDPTAASLLVGVGGTVPVEYIAQVESLEAPLPEVKAEEPAENKAVAAPPKAKRK